MNNEGLGLAASKFVLGLLRSDDLVGVAVQALEDGCDSRSLRVLAGLTEAEVDEAKATFDRVLSELSVAVPSKRDAVILLARKIAREILVGATGPYVGAKQIWNLTLRAPDEDLPELDSFVYAASEWEDRPEDRGAFDEGIAAAAREFINI